MTASLHGPSRVRITRTIRAATLTLLVISCAAAGGYYVHEALRERDAALTLATLNDPAVATDVPLRIVLLLQAADCEGRIPSLTRFARLVRQSGDTLDAVLFVDALPDTIATAPLARLSRNGRIDVAAPGFVRHMLALGARRTPLVIAVDDRSQIVTMAEVPEISRAQDHMLQAISHISAIARMNARLDATSAAFPTGSR